MAQPSREQISAAWEELRAGVRALVEVDPDRAFFYLRGCACSVESWVRALREQHCAPSKPDSGPEPRRQ